MRLCALKHISCNSNFCVTLSRAHRTRTRAPVRIHVVHLAQKTLPTSSGCWQHYHRQPLARSARVALTRRQRHKRGRELRSHTKCSAHAGTRCTRAAYDALMHVGLHANCGSTHLPAGLLVARVSGGNSGGGHRLIKQYCTMPNTVRHHAYTSGTNAS